MLLVPDVLTAFDRILVFNEGRVVEDGTVGGLCRHRGSFEKMWQLQAEALSSDNLMKAA